MVVKQHRTFKLERGTRQGDPISAHLFIIDLEVVFSLKSWLQRPKMFYTYFLILCLCRWHFLFLRSQKSAIEVMKMFDKFSLFSGLKINNKQCEIAVIAVKQGVKMALCGMECIDLTDDVIKILGINVSYSKKLNKEKISWMMLLKFKTFKNHGTKKFNYWRDNWCF